MTRFQKNVSKALVEKNTNKIHDVLWYLETIWIVCDREVSQTAYNIQSVYWTQPEICQRGTFFSG